MLINNNTVNLNKQAFFFKGNPKKETQCTFKEKALIVSTLSLGGVLGGLARVNMDEDSFLYLNTAKKSKRYKIAALTGAIAGAIAGVCFAQSDLLKKLLHPDDNKK